MWAVLSKEAVKHYLCISSSSSPLLQDSRQKIIISFTYTPCPTPSFLPLFLFSFKDKVFQKDISLKKKERKEASLLYFAVVPAMVTKRWGREGTSQLEWYIRKGFLEFWAGVMAQVLMVWRQMGAWAGGFLCSLSMENIFYCQTWS